MKVKKAVKLILDIVELYIPIATFSVLFVTFIWSIIKRYVFKDPCNWATDVELGCYIWMILFSASYVMRKDKHVRFTIVYDLCSPKIQTVLRLISNLMIIVPFAILFKPTLRYIMNLKTISPALQLPLKLYYFPILWFIASVFLNAAYAFITDTVHCLKNGNDTKENGRMEETE